MFSSAELIEALRRRMRRSLRPPPPPGEFPPGWRDWFLAMAARPGRVTGASAGEVIAAVALRGQVPPGGSDERWMRIASMSGSLLVHLLLVVAIAWLMFTRFHFSTPAAEARAGEEHVLQVEYIGEGTPADAGGGMAASPVDEAGAESAPAAPAVPTVVSAPPAPEPEPEPEPELAGTTTPPPLDPPTVEPSVPEPGAVEPVPLPLQQLAIDVPVPEVREVQVVPQALQVTEVEVADRRFEVPPPRDVQPELPTEMRPAEVAVRPRAVDIDAPVETSAPAVPAPRRVELTVPGAAAPEVAVRERRLDLAEAPVLPSALRYVAGVEARQPDARPPGVRERSVPMPAERPAATAAQESTAAATTGGSGQTSPDARSTRDGAQDRAASSASSAPAATDGGRTEMQGAADAAAPTAGAGQLPGQPPGALPSSRASDDWGDSSRNVTGRQAGSPESSGLFNADGSVRLADGGRVGGGLPPGTITEDFENVDRHGTWLKRPPYDYEPTSFDRFWLPSETLLEEWVRASVTEVLIPIPGTTKSIRCVTVLLALGGGCGIVDPNLQEQPAAARPPPEVPFKRELQEDQGSLGPASPPEP